jgi:hypothetical protein
MSKLTFLPIIIISVFAMFTAMFTWAMARHVEMANEDRAGAALRPRSRPYATTMPESLIRR